MCVAALDTGAFTTCCAQSFGRLRRHGLIALADNGTQGEWQRFEHELPNGLWQMDFKGYFETAAGRCSPRTLLDDHSRFALATTACSKTDAATVQVPLQRVFERYGLRLRASIPTTARPGAHPAPRAT